MKGETKLRLDGARGYDSYGEPGDGFWGDGGCDGGRGYAPGSAVGGGLGDREAKLQDTGGRRLQKQW